MEPDVDIKPGLKAETKTEGVDEDDEFFRSSVSISFTGTATATPIIPLSRYECFSNQDDQNQPSKGHPEPEHGQLSKTRRTTLSKRCVQIQNERNAQHPKAIKCEFCGNLYRGKLVLRRHHIVIHKLKLPNWEQVVASDRKLNAKIPCHLCGKLVGRRSMQIHLSNIHKNVGPQQPPDKSSLTPRRKSPVFRRKNTPSSFDTAGWKSNLPTETCNLCGHTFRHKYTLRVHHAKVHKVELPRIYSKRAKSPHKNPRTTKVIPATQPFKFEPKEQEKTLAVAPVTMGVATATDWTARVRCLLCPKICGRLHIFDHLRNVHNKPGARRFYELVSTGRTETGQHQRTAQSKPASGLQDITPSPTLTRSPKSKEKVESRSLGEQPSDQTSKAMNGQVEHQVKNVQCTFCEEVMPKALIGFHLVEQHSENLGLERYYRETDNKTVPVPSEIQTTKKDPVFSQGKRRRGRGHWLRLMSEKARAEAELSRACIDMLTRKAVVKVQRLEEIY